MWVEEESGWTLDIVQRPRRCGWYPIDVEPPPMPAFECQPPLHVILFAIVLLVLATLGKDRFLFSAFSTRATLNLDANLLKVP
jgi:hypothetical protein